MVIDNLCHGIKSLFVKWRW